MLALAQAIPAAWREALTAAVGEDHLAQLDDFVRGERAAGPVFPPVERVFAALELTPPERVKVLLIGQDPYHDDGQAHGLAFSVPAGIKFPPSLRNIFKELESDLGLAAPDSGDLTGWGEEGVLLLNSVLTVRAHQAGSHGKRGWEILTDAVLRLVSAGKTPTVFILWGAWAASKRPLIDETRHRVIEGVHPSPLSAHRGFFGSRPFSTANRYLAELGREPVDWKLETRQMEFDLR